MNIDIMQIMQLLSSGNPQQAVMNLLQNEANTNPVFANLLQLVQSGNMQGIEQVARNIVSSQGKDFDVEFNKFTQQLKGANNKIC